MKPSTWRMTLLTIIGLLFVAPQTSNGLRILGLFPHHGESHFYFFEPILKALDSAGHEVHIVSHFEMKNMTENFKNIIVSKPGSSHNSIDLSMFDTRPSFIHFLEFFMLRDWARDNCEITYSTPAVQELIKNTPKYDLILMELFTSDCMFGISHLIKAPVIGLSSCAMMPWHYSRMGNPQTPSLTPALFMGYSDEMSFKQRLSNWFTFYAMKALYYTFSDTESNKVIKKYVGGDVPDVRELAQKTSMFFVNQHYSLGGAKPISPAVVELGGIHIAKQKPLDEDLENFISSAKHGVIYISWGSMIRASTLPKDKMMSILNALQQLKQKVVWKLDGELPAHPATDKIFNRKWLPQRDILCHENVKVAWLHGGYGGSAEAAHCGIPVAMTPMYGDQHLNSAAFVNRGVGTVVSYEDIETENVLKALKFALKPTTAKNAKELAHSFNTRPMDPKDLAVFWVEHTAEMGERQAKYVKPASVNKPWFIYYGLDVISVIIGSLVGLVLSWMWLLRVVFKKKQQRQTVSNGKKRS